MRWPAPSRPTWRISCVNVRSVLREDVADSARRRTRASGLGKAPVTQAGIVAQRRGGRRVQRHLALLAVLGGADVQHAVVEVDIVAVERQGLAGPQAGCRQQTDQRLVTQRAQRGREPAGGGHQRLDLRRGVNVWRHPRTMRGQQILGGTSLAGSSVATYRAKPRTKPSRRRHQCGWPRVSVAHASAPLVMCSRYARSVNATNPPSRRPGRVQLEPEPAAEPQIVLKGCA